MYLDKFLIKIYPTTINRHSKTFFLISREIFVKEGEEKIKIIRNKNLPSRFFIAHFQANTRILLRKTIYYSLYTGKCTH